jgi:hypothetical protein
MSWSNKKNRKGRSKLTLTSFVALDRFMLDCPAWLALSLAARSAYVEIVRLYSGENNGRIGLSARTLGTRLNISKSTAADALRDLVAKGFVDVAKPGGFNLKTGDKRGTEWRLTRWQCNVTQAPPSRSFMAWKPDTAKPQKKITVRTQAHNGPATGPQGSEIASKAALVGTTPDRNAHFGQSSGAPGRTHIDFYHAPLSPAKAGAANQRASVPTSPLKSQTPIATNNPAHGPESFTTIGGQPLKSLSEIEISIPVTLATDLPWQRVSEPNELKAALARLGGNIKRAGQSPPTIHNAA